MNVDASALSALLIAAAAFVTAMGTLAQAKSRAQRAETRMLRKENLIYAADNYLLRKKLADNGIPVPPKPKGLERNGED